MSKYSSISAASNPSIAGRRILVTGGAGFIGSHVVEQLLSLKAQVIAIDNLNSITGQQQRELKLTRAHSHPSLVFYQADILDQEALDKIFEQPIDIIIHLAALAGVRNSLLYPEKYYQVNVIGTLRLLELAHIHQVSHFIFASSSSVYGSGAQVPFQEAQSLGTATSPYAASKAAAETLCQTYYYLYGVKTTILRFFSVFGPRGRQDMAPFIFAKALASNKPLNVLGSPEDTLRDFTYVKDIVNGLVAAIEYPTAAEVINLGSGIPLPLSRLIQELEQNFKKKAQLIIHEKNRTDLPLTFASIKKAEQLLHWKPSTSFSVGIKLFVTWFKKHYPEG